MRERSRSYRVLVILLRVVGLMTCTAIVAAVMPTSWIVATNDWVGLGAFPDAPITQYLARTLSALYAAFGVLTIIVSYDVIRYLPIIMYLAYSCLIFGILLLLVDFTAGMPTAWTLYEGPMALLLGAIILLLARRVRRGVGAAHEGHDVRNAG